MAERKSLLAQARLRRGAEEATLQGGGERLAVHVQHPVEAPQVERHHPGQAVTHRLHPAHDAGAAAERHDRHALAGAGLEHGTHLLRGPGSEHRVGGAQPLAGAQPHQIRVAAPGRVLHARLAVLAEAAAAEGGQQGIARTRRERRLRQPELLESQARARLAGLGPDLLAQERVGGVGEPARVLVLAPAPPAHV